MNVGGLVMMLIGIGCILVAIKGTQGGVFKALTGSTATTVGTTTKTATKSTSSVPATTMVA